MLRVSTPSSWYIIADDPSVFLRNIASGFETKEYDERFFLSNFHQFSRERFFLPSFYEYEALPLWREVFDRSHAALSLSGAFYVLLYKDFFCVNKNFYVTSYKTIYLAYSEQKK